MGVDILKKLLEYRDSKQYTFILFKVGEGQIYTGFRKVCAWGGGGGGVSWHALFMKCWGSLFISSDPGSRS